MLQQPDFLVQLTGPKEMVKQMDRGTPVAMILGNFAQSGSLSLDELILPRIGMGHMVRIDRRRLGLLQVQSSLRV